MPCELEQKDSAFPGETYQTKLPTTCMQPTAIYFPRKRPAPGDAINVVLWLHGFLVQSLDYLFHGDDARIRDQVRNCGKDAALIAPFLGYEHKDEKEKDPKKRKWVGNYDVTQLATKNWGERYLSEVLDAVRDFGATGKDPRPPIEINNLYVACHSAGGRAMRAIIGNLGKNELKLKGCWGLDCLYHERDPKIKGDIEDAQFWYGWASNHPDKTLDIVLGESTIHQSVKLDLMARGIATPEGNKLETPGASLKNLKVTIGHYDMLKLTGETVRDLAPPFVDQFTLPQEAEIARMNRLGMNRHGEFLDKVIANVRKAFPFADDIHFMIARGALLDRLKTL